MLMVKKLNLWWSLNNPIFCHCGGHKSRNDEENEYLNNGLSLEQSTPFSSYQTIENMDKDIENKNVVLEII